MEKQKVADLHSIQRLSLTDVMNRKKYPVDEYVNKSLLRNIANVIFENLEVMPVRISEEPLSTGEIEKRIDMIIIDKEEYQRLKRAEEELNRIIWNR